MMIGESSVMQAVRKLIQRVGRAALPVLVTGETGTGKELVAREVHASSPRSAGPFVALNCGGLPETLLESELFGHARGAFTGADRDRKGVFAAADGGTLFLDEVNSLPMAAQAKLLRVLQEGTVRPVGSDREVRVNVRVVAATNADLRREVEAGRFRSDLFFRLDVLRVNLPALRERLDDIEPLVLHFLRGTGIASVEASALAALASHSWPGNVRELQNEIQRAACMCDGSVLTASNLSIPLPVDRITRRAPAPVQLAPASNRCLDEQLMDAERSIIAAALAAHGGNRTHTARALGITRIGLLRKMSRLGLADYPRHGVSSAAEEDPVQEAADPAPIAVPAAAAADAAVPAAVPEPAPTVGISSARRARGAFPALLCKRGEDPNLLYRYAGEVDDDARLIWVVAPAGTRRQRALASLFYPAPDVRLAG